jgi:hypothetical protein
LPAPERGVSFAEDYILLGLRLGRHVDGLVDAYYGPPELKEQASAEDLADPAELVADADRLLAGLEEGWLRDQAEGLRTYAGVLAGEELSYSDEVERCYGVRPRRVGTETYEAVHDELEELLPGDGTLGERYEDWRTSRFVATEKIVPAMRDVVGLLRAATEKLVDLPAGEGLDVEEVSDEPWWAFNYYLGGLRSRVVVNVDVPDICDDLVELAAHEVYPGHHTEHAVKEQLFIRERGELEESIQLVPTPASLLQEGVAEAGPDVILDDELAAQLTGALARHGLDYDLAVERRMREARRPLRRIGVDAALMVHEDGATTDEVEQYLVRWGIVTPERARHTIQFVTDPTWRAYVITYSAGGDLCREWVAGDPARFARLLTEHLRVSDLAASVSSGP